MERHWDERLAVRFPALSGRLFASLLRLPPRSALKRWLMERNLARGYQALDRGDFEYLMLFYEPQAEVNVFGADAIGLKAHYGPGEAIRHFNQDLVDAWEDIRFVPEKLLDLGTWLIHRVRILGRGRRSGADLNVLAGVVYTIARGRVAKVDIYRHWSELEQAFDLRGRQPEATIARGWTPGR